MWHLNILFMQDLKLKTKFESKKGSRKEKEEEEVEEGGRVQDGLKRYK